MGGVEWRAIVCGLSELLSGTNTPKVVTVRSSRRGNERMKSKIPKGGRVRAFTKRDSIMRVRGIEGESSPTGRRTFFKYGEHRQEHDTRKTSDPTTRFRICSRDLEEVDIQTPSIMAGRC